MWARLSGARRVIGFDPAHLREPQGRPVVYRNGAAARRAHVIQKNLSLLAGPGRRSADRCEAAARARYAGMATIEAIAAIGGAGHYVVLNPGAAWPNKRWPAERFGALAAALFDRDGAAVVRDVGAIGARSGRCGVPRLERAPRNRRRRPRSPISPRHDARRRARDFRRYRPAAHRRRDGQRRSSACTVRPGRSATGPGIPDDVVISRAGECVCHHKRQCLRGSPCIDDIAIGEVFDGGRAAAGHGGAAR